MSGHSKWSTIKHKKAKTDAARGKVFTKAAREIIIAAKLGGADPGMNTRLRLAIQKAKEVNMPNDNIKRAIQKGAGSGDGASLEDLTLEAYGPSGVAILIQTLTDNKNRTVPNVKHILTKANASLATKGAVSYLFEKKGLFIFEPGSPEDDVIDIATENDADDIDIKPDESIEVITDPSHFERLRTILDDKSIAYIQAEIAMMPTTSVECDQDLAQKVYSLIEKLEEDDDVQDVYTNANFPDDFEFE